jgi:hypothetical protein
MKFKKRQTAFHITYKKNLQSILKIGLLPKIPKDYEQEQKGIYLFPTFNDAENALGSWLEDRIDENEDLIALEIDITDLNPYITQSVEWELICSIPIKPNRILKYIDID